MAHPSTVYLNIFFSETAHWLLTKFHRNEPRVVLYQSCSSWLPKLIMGSKIVFPNAIFYKLQGPYTLADARERGVGGTWHPLISVSMLKSTRPTALMFGLQ